MNMDTTTSPINSIKWIMRGVMIELTRRQDVYVLGLLMIIFCIGSVAVKAANIEEGATGTFVLNLGMTLSHIFAHVLTLLLSARQIPTELENRTLYPILAKPVAREQFIAGKWLACMFAGVIAYSIFMLMVWFSAPKLESYSTGLLFQTVLLQLTSLGLTAVLGLLFSLLVPTATAVVILGIIIFFGSSIIGFIQSFVTQPALQWVMLYIPDFSKLNLTTRYTDGIDMLSAPVFLGLLLYAILYIVVANAVSHYLFQRRSL